MQLVARDKPGLLVAMMRVLAGAAHISFEGRLAECRDLYALPGASEVETTVLRRNTLFPRQDFVVLPLEAPTLRPILDVVLPAGRLVRDIVHVQIERGGVLQVGSYDSFHPRCIVCGDGVPVTLLANLKDSGVLRSWRRDDEEESVVDLDD